MSFIDNESIPGLIFDLAEQGLIYVDNVLDVPPTTAKALIKYGYAGGGAVAGFGVDFIQEYNESGDLGYAAWVGNLVCEGLIQATEDLFCKFVLIRAGQLQLVALLGADDDTGARSVLGKHVDPADLAPAECGKALAKVDGPAVRDGRDLLDVVSEALDDIRRGRRDSLDIALVNMGRRVGEILALHCFHAGAAQQKDPDKAKHEMFHNFVPF